MRLTVVSVLIVLLFSGIVKGQDLKNVQVLPYKNTREIVPYMKGMAKDLGVKCSYCHNMKNKSLDEIQHKFIARDMMSMVKQINEDFMTPMKVDAITCWTCHRGSTAPPHSIDDKPKPHDH